MIQKILQKLRLTPPKKKLIIESDVIGFGDPIQAILPIKIKCICRKCGSEWQQNFQNQYVSYNTIYLFEKCTNCLAKQ